MRSDEKLGQNYGLSRDKVAKYIRISNLIEPLIFRVDSGEIAFLAAYDLSFVEDNAQQHQIADLMFGNEKTTACHPIAGEDLNERLERAISYLDGEYTEATSEYEGEKEVLPESISADPNVRNFSYGLVDGELYYRENSRMYKQNITGRKAERIQGMKLKSEGFEDLVLEAIGGDEYSIAHYYRQNGDSMRPVLWFILLRKQVFIFPLRPTPIRP